MTSAVQRHLRITYGSRVIGDATDLELDGPILLFRSDDAFRAEFAFVYSVPPGDPTPEVTFATNVALIEADLRRRQLRTLIEFGSDLAGTPRTRIDFDPSTGINSALNVRVEWTAERELTHTVRSVRYEVAISGGLPADAAGLLGKRVFDTQITRDSALIAAITFTGTFTALGADLATVQFLERIVIEENLVIAAQFPGEVFVLQEPNDNTFDIDNQVLTFSRTYVQLIDPESPNVSSSVLDDADFADQTLVITRRRIEGRAEDANANPLLELTASFSTRVTAIAANRGLPALKEKIDDVLVPWIASRIQEVVGGATTAILEVTPDFEPKRSNLRLTMRAAAVSGSGKILLRTIITSDNEQPNDVLRKLYPNGSEQRLDPPSAGGNAFGRPRAAIPRAFRFRTAATVRRTITDTVTLLGASSLGDVSGGGGQSPAGLGFGALNLDAPFQNAFGGLGVISAPGESFLSFEGPGGGEGGGGGGNADSNASPGQVTTIVVDRGYQVFNAKRGIKGILGLIATTEVVSSIVLEFYEVATVAGSSGGAPRGTREREPEKSGVGPSSTDRGL